MNSVNDFRRTGSEQLIQARTDSNLWGGHSGHVYTVTSRPDQLTEVDVVMVREGKNVKGKLLGLAVGAIGKSTMEKSLGQTMRAIEARHYGEGAP